MKISYRMMFVRCNMLEAEINRIDTARKATKTTAQNQMILY